MKFEEMLFTIPKDKHSTTQIKKILWEHPEIQFISLVGLDIGGHDTDEKIPVELFIKNMNKYLSQGVQTDGSSVVLPKIAELNDAKVDIIPDPEVHWHVDYNFSHKLEGTDTPVGTLRIPSLLLHNEVNEVGARVILKDTTKVFQEKLLRLMKEHPYVLDYINIDSVDDIEEIVLTGATELEFWVKTPEDKGDREQLSTSQELKEQYWQRTRGSVRTALERSIILLEQYGFEVEMGHKEVGGIKAKLGNSGEYTHIMEQLEIDWKYDTAIQAADNELIIKYIIKDIFRLHGLEVSFNAKPIEDVAGSGMHTHMGVAAKLKNGKTINLFSPKQFDDYFMTPIGFGALMGILKNYEIVNPFITSTNDAFNRLKVGFEAPVCIVTSLGHEVSSPSRNRTILVGLIRDLKSPLATRFELRSPNPKSNTYLVMATSYLAMLDGIEAALTKNLTPDDLIKILSKKRGQKVYYLEKDREYRSEKNVYEDYTQKQREELFGKVPESVYENLSAFDKFPKKVDSLKQGGVFDDRTIESYKEATISQWAMELKSRLIPNTMNLIRDCVKLHGSKDSTDLDEKNWKRIDTIRKHLGRDTVNKKCLLTKIKIALDKKDYAKASKMQIEMQDRERELSDLYLVYKKNIL